MRRKGSWRKSNILVGIPRQSKAGARGVVTTNRVGRYYKLEEDKRYKDITITAHARHGTSRHTEGE